MHCRCACGLIGMMSGGAYLADRIFGERGCKYCNRCRKAALR